MSADNKNDKNDKNTNTHDDKNDNPNNIVPYETLKASLDEANAEMIAASAAFFAALNRQDPPMFIKLALHNFDAAYAKATARSSAVLSEYGHLAGVTQNIQDQRDEINRRYESLKKTVNQIKKLNLDDEGANETPPKNDTQNSKGKRQKK